MASGDVHPKQTAAATFGLRALIQRFNLGVLAPVVKSLEERNRIWERAIFKECDSWNVRTIHRETHIPRGQAREIGEGVKPSLSNQGTVTFQTGRLADLSRPTYDAIMATPNPNGVLTQEANRIVRGMSQTLAGWFFYGNEFIHPAQFNGLMSHYNSKALPTVFSAGGSGNDNMSIYAVTWDLEEGLHFIYPQNAKMPLGIFQYHLEPSAFTDLENGGEFLVERTFFCIEWGLAIGRPDNIGRYGDLKSDGSANTFNDDIMAEMLDSLWMPDNVICYAPQKLLTQMGKLARAKPNVDYKSDEVHGHVINSFQGRQIHRVDRMSLAEAPMAA